MLFDVMLFGLWFGDSGLWVSGFEGCLCGCWVWWRLLGSLVL